MRDIYSRRFITQQGLSGASATITVPAGHVYVVKQLTFFSSPSFGTVRGFFMDAVSGAALFAAAASIGGGVWEGFYGQLVFQEGDQFVWHASGTLSDAADVGAFGYDLTA